MYQNYHSLCLSRAIYSAHYRRVANVSLLMTALIAGLAATPVAAAVYSATLDTNGGNWSDPTIWSSSSYPNNDSPSLGDTWNVNIGLSVTVDTLITIDNLNWSAGVISIPNPNSLTLVGSASTWSSNSGKYINGPAANFLNGGTITLTGTNVYSYTTGSGLTNLSGGVFDISGDGVALSNSYGTGVFANQLGATFDKSAGSGTSVVAMDLQQQRQRASPVGHPAIHRWRHVRRLHNDRFGSDRGIQQRHIYVAERRRRLRQRHLPGQ